MEKTIIDRCVRMVYRDSLADPVPENMPILEDLYNALLTQEEKEAQYIATALEIYVTGSLNVFNHRTSINIENRIVSFDIKELGKQLKKIGTRFRLPACSTSLLRRNPPPPSLRTSRHWKHRKPY